MKFIKNFALALAFMTPTLMSAELMPVQNEKGKWGFVDENGSLVVKYDYTAVGPFQGKYARIQKGDKWGFINKNGEVVIKPEYDNFSSFTETGVAIAQKDKKYGYINTELQFIVPVKFTNIGAFNADGLVWVADKNKYGIYNINGSVFIEPKYKAIGVFVPYESDLSKIDWSKCSVAEKSHLKYGGSYTLYRKTGIDKTYYSKIPESPIGYFYSNDEQSYKNSVISPSGDVIFPAGKYHAVFYPNDGIAPVALSNSQYNFISIGSGQKLLKRPVLDAWGFDANVAIVKVKLGKGSKMQFVNRSGEFVGDKKYDNIYPLNHGVYVTYNDGLYGMADEYGNEIIAPKYKYMTSTTNGMWAVSEDSQTNFHFIDNKGKIAINQNYDFAMTFVCGYAPVQQNKKYGIIDESGKVVVPFEFENVIIPDVENLDIFWVSSGSNADGISIFEAYSTKKAGKAFEGQYFNVGNFGKDFEGIAFVSNSEGKCGCIDTNGNIIIGMDLDNYDQAKQAYQMYLDRGKTPWTKTDSHRIRLQAQKLKAIYRFSNVLSNSDWEY